MLTPQTQRIYTNKNKSFPLSEAEIRGGGGREETHTAGTQHVNQQRSPSASTTARLPITTATRPEESFQLPSFSP